MTKFIRRKSKSLHYNHFQTNDVLEIVFSGISDNNNNKTVPQVHSKITDIFIFLI